METILIIVKIAGDYHNVWLWWEDKMALENKWGLLIHIDRRCEVETNKN